MAYALSYTPAASKAIERLEVALQRRVLARLESLASDPRAPGCIKLRGEEAYRVRVGDYRIIYSIHDRELIVLVVDVGHRGDVYRRR